jgi:hypothetical protein
MLPAIMMQPGRMVAIFLRFLFGRITDGDNIQEYYLFREIQHLFDGRDAVRIGINRGPHGHETVPPGAYLIHALKILLLEVKHGHGFQQEAIFFSSSSSSDVTIPL